MKETEKKILEEQLRLLAEKSQSASISPVELYQLSLAMVKISNALKEPRYSPGMLAC